MRKHQLFRWLCVSSIILAAGSVTSSSSHVAAAGTCVDTGENCVLGGVGPKGGIIFYDAGSIQWWGRYLEAESSVPKSATVAWGSVGSIYGADPNRAALQRQSMAIGMGKWNTKQMKSASSPLATAFFGEGDWYLPSKDELDALYRFKVPFTGPAWTSSESEDSFAWYQLFKDGTQFTDANGIIPRLKTNKNYLTSAVHVGSGFKAEPIRVIRIRAFPPSSSEPPPAILLSSARNNAKCAESALECKVGDIGPGGGIVVYDAGKDMSWGRYLEIAPKNCEISGVSFLVGEPSNLGPGNVAYTTRIGSGWMNTQFLNRNPTKYQAAKLATSRCNGFYDWFLPSKDELNEAFRVLSHSRTGLKVTPLGQFERGYYWTSSNYNGSTAWTQYFADGQQFDRVQTLSRNKKPPMNPFLIRPIRAFKEAIPRSYYSSNVSFAAKSKVVSGKRFVEVTGSTSTLAPGETLTIDIYWGVSFFQSKTMVRDDGTFSCLVEVRSTLAPYVVFLVSPDGSEGGIIGE